ncbi:molybdopterin synthase catalytic subunit [Silvibacterium bohemicum]|uniref:Molybdopterin synthase catalytic subunit n=1 Tax=Silvibacterium bohemicum TaxID=1577686 RepID=A0A841K085_9BACT|nr:molybdenum cofactor biosynthesis protein MoaE [Silvibacterium bohemicum]MBB6145369.1 molybdopterin synthase catalytic subunit [Silvibacterium bohemicum]
MRIKLLLFGILRDLIPDLVSRKDGELELPTGATVADLLQTCRQSLAGHDQLWASCAVAVNREYTAAAHVLREGDEVALLPPVSGGSSSVAVGNIVHLTRDPIDTQQIVRLLKDGSDGAVTIFDGIVRNNTHGRRTLFLDYQAYEEMALKQMQELATKSIAEFKVRQVAVVHRLGKLEIGETSVLIAVASAHRGAAFDACRWLIDTLKKTVPIWKKEHFEDGAVWADGEPFPAEILSQPEPRL